MGSGRAWTSGEVNHLEEKWGAVSVGCLATKLGRTRNAIILKAKRLSLGPFLMGGEYVTFYQLLCALGYENSGYTYKMKSWVKNRGCPVRTKRVNQNTFKIIYIEDFWGWAEKNQAFLDFSRFEENMLGKEPGWVKSKRRSDMERSRKYKITPWMAEDDARLRKLLKEYKYSYADLSERLQRTCGAIQRRILDLELKERPVKADNHNPWTDRDKELLKQMILDGKSYEHMQEAIGRSAKAIRGYVGRAYKTEVLDKVRETIIKDAGREKME